MIFRHHLSRNSRTEHEKAGFTGGWEGDATVMIGENSPENFGLMCSVIWRHNGLSRASLIIGIVLFGVLWFLPATILFIDPLGSDNHALNIFPRFIEQSYGMRPSAGGV